jgi:hypothetical protein
MGVYVLNFWWRRVPPLHFFKISNPFFIYFLRSYRKSTNTIKFHTNVSNKNGLFTQVDLWQGSGLKVQKTYFCWTRRPFMATWSNFIRKLTFSLDSPSNSTIETVLVIQHWDYSNPVRRLILVKNWLKSTKLSLLSTASDDIRRLVVVVLKN